MYINIHANNNKHLHTQTTNILQRLTETLKRIMPYKKGSKQEGQGGPKTLLIECQPRHATISFRCFPIIKTTV